MNCPKCGSKAVFVQSKRWITGGLKSQYREENSEYKCGECETEFSVVDSKTPIDAKPNKGGE